MAHYVLWMAIKPPRLLHLQLCKIKVVKNPGPITSTNGFHGVPADINSPTMDQPTSRQAAAGGRSILPHDFSNVMEKIQVLSQALRR